MCFQESEAKDIIGANICFKFLQPLTLCRTPMAPGRGCLALAILLAIVDIQLGGGMHIQSSFRQEGKRLSLICTLRYKKEEAEGVIVFLCKDRSSDCFPETSLEQLRLKRDPGRDGVSEISSQLVFTINQTTPWDSGTYQCCATSRKPDIRLQGRFFSVLVTETGNYTVKGLKRTGHPEFSHSKGTLGSGFLQEKAWVMLVTSLVALQDDLLSWLSGGRGRGGGGHRRETPDWKNYVNKEVKNTDNFTGAKWQAIKKKQTPYL